MSVDLSKVKVGMKVRLRDERILGVVSIEVDRSVPFPFYITFDNGADNVYMSNGSACMVIETDNDIIEILQSEEPKEETCLWSYDRDVPDRPDMPIWKTSCGYEFDRLKGCEQPRKHLRMEFCPYCGKHIADATTDC